MHNLLKLSDEELDAAIAALPFEKVTKAAIEARISHVDYTVLPNSTVTICSITLDNKFSVRGEAACVDPQNFNLQIGRELSYRDAFNKLWPLFGFLLAERRFLRAKQPQMMGDNA